MKKLFFLIAVMLTAVTMYAQPSTPGSITASGTDCTTDGACVSTQLPPGNGGVAIQVSGTYTGTLQFEATVWGTEWFAVGGQVANGSAVGTSTTSTGAWTFSTVGMSGFRVRGSAYTNGRADVIIQPSMASPATLTAGSLTGTFAIDQSVPGVTNAVNAAVSGFLTNDAAAPTTGQIGVLPAKANAAQQTVTEGRQELLSVDLHAKLRTLGCDPTADICAGVDANGNMKVVSPDPVYNSTQPTCTNGNPCALQTDSRGDFKVIQGVAGFATDSESATGAAVPAKANYIGGQGSGNLTGYLRCDSSIVYDTNTNGKTQLVGLVSGKITYVCGVSLSNSTTTTVNVSLGTGTGTNCGSTYTAKTPAWPLQAPTSVAPAGLVLPIANAPWFQTAASEELCISTTAGVSVQALVSYTQF